MYWSRIVENTGNLTDISSGLESYTNKAGKKLNKYSKLA